MKKSFISHGLQSNIYSTLLDWFISYTLQSCT